MEMAVEGTSADSKTQFQDRNGAYTDVCDWPGVRCDDSLDVTEVRFHNMNLQGTVSFAHFPESIKRLQVIIAEGLKGSIETHLLPQSLTYFVLYRTALTGTLDMRALPPNLTVMDLSSNAFEGSADLAKLPPNLEFLDIPCNQLSGSLALDTLPCSLFELNVSSNHLSGEVDLQHLPPSLEQLWINDNMLSGRFELVNISENLRYVDAECNKFQGTAVIAKVDHPLWITLRQNDVSAFFDEKGEAHPSAHEIRTKGYMAEYMVRRAMKFQAHKAE